MQYVQIFNSSLLQDLRCLHPSFRDKTLTVICIGRHAETMPHIINPLQISQVKDEWKALQAEDIPQEWTKGCIDHYYHAKIFDIKNSHGGTKYNVLRNLVKSALSLQNGNTGVERSLSDNKSMLTHMRCDLSAPTGERRCTKKDEIQTDKMQSVAENMLKEGNEGLVVAVSKKDMDSVEIAYTLIVSTKKKLENKD